MNLKLIIKIARILVLLLAVLLVSVSLFTRANVKNIDEDEVTFIERGKFFDWYISGDFDRPEWQSFESYDVPKFAEFFYGAVIRTYTNKPVILYLSEISFFEDNTEKAGSWRTTETRDKDFFINSLPEDIQSKITGILLARKATLIFFTIPLLILFYLIGKKSDSEILGLVFMTLIGTNALFIETMVTAMGDAPLWFFAFIFLFFSYGYSKKLSRSKENLNLVVLGITVGLATSVKLNGLILILNFLILNLYLFKNKTLNIVSILKNTFVILFISFTTFFLLNPYLWKHPIQNSLKMIHHRKSTISFQQLEVGPENSLLNLNDKVQAVFYQTVSSKSIYTNFKLDKNNLIFTIHTDLTMIGIGLYILFKQLKEKELNNNKTITIFFLFSLAFITLLNIPLNWDRYYLPFIFLWGFLESVAISFFIKKVIKL
jgi:hypothetical protein